MNWLDAIREAAAALAVGEAIAPPPEPPPEPEPAVVGTVESAPESAPVVEPETAAVESPGAVRVCSAPDDGEAVCRDVEPETDP